MKKRRLKLFIKPTNKCNKKCIYCFSSEEQESDNLKIKDIEEIKELIEKTAEEARIYFHGGEFTLMGKKWMEEAFKILRSSNIKMEISAQTNGVLLDKELIDIFKKYNIKASTSNDGIFNSKSRGESKEDAGATIKKIKSIGRGGGSILVINKYNVKDLIQEYNYYINTLEVKPAFNFQFELEKTKENDEFVKEQIKAMIDLFDHTFMNKELPMERTLKTFVKAVVDEGQYQCIFSNCLGNWLSVNPGGELSICDRRFPKEYNMGNIKHFNYSLVEAYLTEGFQKLKKDHLEMKKYCDETCDFSKHCNGGCIANNVARKPRNRPNEYWCKVFKEVFAHVFNRLKDIDIQELDMINEEIKVILLNNGYRSLTIIREAMRASIDEKVKR